MEMTTLIACLRAAAPANTVLGGDDTLAPLLEALLSEAHGAWPGVTLPDEEFVVYVAERLPAEPPGLSGQDALRRLCTRDLYLALACLRGDGAALAAFEAHCLDSVDGALGRLSAAGDVITEVKQRLRRSLLVADGQPPAIAQFSGRGNLRAWVRVIAVREALALMRQARKDSPLEDALLAQRLMPADDPELSYLKNVYRQEFKSAFAASMAALGDRARTLLRQQLIDGLSIDELGALYHVHRATAARWLESARRQLVEDTLAALRSRLQVQPDELDSILRLIRSQLDVSVGGLAVRKRGRKG
jgi:RNA polymerase sigma-70 factor, ECF subfamily